jgi:pimeloyl-ACP methyl ester carboxylesterase
MTAMTTVRLARVLTVTVAATALALPAVVSAAPAQLPSGPPEPQSWRKGPGPVVSAADASGADTGTPREAPASGADVTRLAVAPRVPTQPCPEDPAWLCGKVKVPLDRAEPSAGRIPIAFEIFPQQGQGPALTDPILMTAGGPGDSASAKRYFLQYIAGPLLEDRDLVLIDNRGTGKSRPIDCPRLQDGVRNHRDFIDSVGACGRRLRDQADRYGTGDVAMDVEAVRRALGYPRINYYGGSYASVAAQAYAVRYPSRLRSVVVDSGMPVNDPEHIWTWGTHIPGALDRYITLSCVRVPECAAAHPDADRAFTGLMRRVARNPVVGAARDQDGNRRRVTVGELQLGAIAYVGHWLNGGEIAAAADALRMRDRKPLLRLAAETPVWPGDSGDPAGFSAGNNAAAFCNDAGAVWERTDPVSVRREKYRDALRAFPSDRFAPYTRRAWTTQFPSDFCLKWPSPDRFVPAVPPGATVTGIPILLIVGDLDTAVPTETTEALLDVFPHAELVTVAGAGHTAAGWSDCAHGIVNHFFATLDVGDTSCTEEPSFVPAAVSQFFRTSADATPARRLDGDESSRRHRLVATSTVRAVQDAWLRSFRQVDAVADGPGLRGGTFRADYESFADHAEIRLRGVRFTRDVAVTGRSTFAYATNGVRMRVRVDGPGRLDGTIRANGTYGPGAPFAAFTVSGLIGESSLEVEVPAA